MNWKVIATMSDEIDPELYKLYNILIHLRIFDIFETSLLLTGDS
jgi:hypothetical protein